MWKHVPLIKPPCSAGRSEHIWSGQARMWVWSIIVGVVSKKWTWAMSWAWGNMHLSKQHITMKVNTHCRIEASKIIVFWFIVGVSN